jgi:hypothetical protein
MGCEHKRGFDLDILCKMLTVRQIHFLCALLGCILPEASRQTYFVPQAVESARYSNFLGARGHY